jgi:hypothetical protein
MKTKVTFRKLDSEVIALFPDEVTKGSQWVASYERYGQHSDASADGIREWERATPEEYGPLLAELVGIGYDLEVVE